jgi:fluoroquinolone resistance protein
VSAGAGAQYGHRSCPQSSPGSRVTDRSAAGRSPHTVRGEDWGAGVLDGFGAAGVEYVDVDMTELTTRRAVFEQCSFRDVRLNASVHEASAFLNCTFVSCNLFDASFTGCKLVGSRFERCSTRLLRVVDGDWSFVGLPGADLRSVTFSGVRMREADLTGARLDGATVTGVDLSGSSLSRTSWVRCDLRGSDLSSLDPAQAQLRGAIVTEEQAVVVATNLGLDVRPQD